MEIPQNIKNIFSRRALAALNACARFCYNMCKGWGIMLKKGDGYVSVGIDQQQLLKWLKDEKFARARSAVHTEALNATDSNSQASGTSGMLTKDHWDAGQFTDTHEDLVVDNDNNPILTGFEIYVVSRAKKVTDVDYLLFRKVTVNEHGIITAISAEEFAIAVLDDSAYPVFQ